MTVKPVPSRDEIEEFIKVFKILSSYEAREYRIRGYGAFDRTKIPMPMPSVVKVLEWLGPKTMVPTREDHEFFEDRLKSKDETINNFRSFLKDSQNRVEELENFIMTIIDSIKNGPVLKGVTIVRYDEN